MSAHAHQPRGENTQQMLCWQSERGQSTGERKSKAEVDGKNTVLL